MTAWEAFVLGCIVTVAVEMMILAAIWIARSRPSADAVDEVHGDWPHVERGQ